MGKWGKNQTSNEEKNYKQIFLSGNELSGGDELQKKCEEIISGK